MGLALEAMGEDALAASILSLLAQANSIYSDTTAQGQDINSSGSSTVKNEGVGMILLSRNAKKKAERSMKVRPAYLLFSFSLFVFSLAFSFLRNSK